MRRWVVRRVAMLLVAVAALFAPFPAEAGGRTLALYVVVGRTVEIYNAATGASLGAITPPTGDIHGLAVGFHGNVYVSTFEFRTRSTTIYQYEPIMSKPSFRYTFLAPAAGPIAVSEAGQIAFATDCGGEGGCAGPTGIIFFANHIARSIGQAVVLNDYVGQLAYGPGGTLWVASHPNEKIVAYLPPGASSFIPVRLDTALRPISYLPVDEHGDVLSLDPFATVNVFGGRSGQLFRRIPIAGIFEDFTGMVLGPDERLLYVATTHHVLVYGYPQGGVPVATFSIKGPVSGVAVGAL